MTTFTPPGRPAHALTYSERNQLTQVTPPPVSSAGPTTYAYNLDRQLTAVTRGDGRSMALAYDAGGRLVTRSFATAGTVTGADRFSYDSAGRVANIVAVSGESTGYTYDGPLVTARNWSGLVAGSVTRAYDSSFRLASESIGGGSTINFSYDDDDRLIGAGALTIARNPQNGLPTGSALGGVTAAIGYNGFGEVTSHSTSVGGTSLFSNTYVRNALGRIIQRTETIAGTADNYVYTYDPGGQLNTVTRNAVTIESYAYDSNGNRTSSTLGGTTATANYDDQDRVIQAGAATYAYNGAGDLATRTSGGQITTYQYDQIGNLLGVTLPMEEPSPMSSTATTAASGKRSTARSPRDFSTAIRCASQRSSMPSAIS